MKKIYYFLIEDDCKTTDLVRFCNTTTIGNIIKLEIQMSKKELFENLCMDNLRYLNDDFITFGLLKK